MSHKQPSASESSPNITNIQTFTKEGDVKTCPCTTESVCVCFSNNVCVCTDVCECSECGTIYSAPNRTQGREWKGEGGEGVGVDVSKRVGMMGRKPLEDENIYRQLAEEEPQEARPKMGETEKCKCGGTGKGCTCGSDCTCG